MWEVRVSTPEDERYSFKTIFRGSKKECVDMFNWVTNAFLAPSYKDKDVHLVRKAL